nr:hypothetical protein [Candidatus Dependentiae bacterium]
MNKKIFYFYCVCLFFSILFTTNTLSAKIYYAPQGSSNPTIINIANDKNGEIDIKWLNMRSSNDTPSGTNQSYIIYLIYRKSDSDFSNADTQTVMSQGDLIDTVTQVINSGYPSTFTFWSDTSSNLENNKYYYYSIIALDRFDGFYSDASNTVSIKCDTQGPSIQSLYGSTHGNQDYVSKNNIQINLLVYENNSLASGNLYLNYGFKSDTASYIQLNNANSVPMTVSSAETQGFYYVSAILPVTLCGSDTVVVYWISGTDNSSGLNDEIIDYSLDGNIFTSSLLSNSLTDSGNANFLYIDAIAPVLTQVTSPDSYFGFIKGFDTSVVITVSDDMFIETGNFILHHKKQGGTEQTSVMNYNGTRYSGEFTGIIPLNSYSNKDIITFWVTGTDKAGNAVLSTTFITESTGKTVIVDSSGPLVSSFNILNSKDSSADLTFSKNSNADSMYSIELILSDSNPVDTVYLKFYSRQNNNDSTNYMTGSDTVYFIEISETNRITTPSIFLNDGIVYPAVYLKDYFGNITVYSDSQLFSATQLYENNCKTLQVNSVLPKIISITHINNDISDSNTSVSAGDSFIITFNNILDTSSISLIDTAIVNDNGKILGTISAFNWNNIYDSLILTLPADYILNTGDTFHLFETISDIFGNFADTSITSQIPDNAGPILKKVEFINNDYSQRYSTFITSGDTIVLKFSEPMDSSYLTNGIKLNLQDTIKINSGVSKNFGDTSLILWLDSSTLSIGIGYNKLINDGDRISLSNHMRDVYGNQADTLINSEYNAVLYDTIGLNIINAYLD